jgi:hypothetical protein
VSLTAGTRLGPDQIESAIGAGGMGEVYACAGPAGLILCSVTGGDAGQAVEWASKAVDQPCTIVLAMMRPLEPLLRQSPTWPAVLQKMNLSPPLPA